MLVVILTLTEDKYVALILLAFLQLLIVFRMRFCIVLLAGDVPITMHLYLKIPHGERNVNSFLASGSISN